MEPLKQFLAQAKSADLRDKEMFAFVVREGLTLTGMSVRDAGELFRTAPGTVSRWENGHTAPALVARYAVRDLLVNRVTRIASALDQRVSIARENISSGFHGLDSFQRTRSALVVA